MAPKRESGQFNPSDFSADTVRGTSGFFRVGRAGNGRWWFLDSFNRPVFLRAVGAVNRHTPGVRRGSELEFSPAVGGDPQSFVRETSRRLLSWGFNTLGVHSDRDLSGQGLYRIGVVDFLHGGGPVLRAHGLVLPDVFDSAWPAFCHARAKLAASIWRGNTELVGLHTDADLVWKAPVSAGGLGLLQICLGLEPVHTAHHAAWEFVLAPHAGDLTALGRSWGLNISHRETIRQLTRAEQAIDHAAYRADDLRFTREFARRYFQITIGALREHDPEHLIFGERFSSSPPAAVLSECGRSLVDVLTLPAGAVVNAFDHPRLWIGVGLDEGLARPAPTALRVGPTRLERRLAALRRTISKASIDPLVVGYEWARWSDEIGDIAPFAPGLVHLDGSEAREHTELLAPINTRADTRRRTARAG